MTHLYKASWFAIVALAVPLLLGCSGEKNGQTSETRPGQANRQFRPGAKPGPNAAPGQGPHKPGDRIRAFQKALKERELAMYEEARQAATRLASAPDKLKPDALNVVLLTVDTLRFDDTSGFGGKLETTPAIAALAKQGVTFTNTISPGPWTVPAMYSLITGLYPSEHGITGGLVNPLVNKIMGQPVLPQAASTLAERLKGMGYGTFGVCTNFHLSRKYGYAQGFDMFVGEDFDSMPFPNFVAESFQAELRKVEKYFLWVHYFDPHSPYKTQSPWFTQWNDSPFNSTEEVIYDILTKYYRDKSGIGADGPFFPPHALPLKKFAALAGARPAMLNAGLTYIKAGVDSPHIKLLRAAYRSEVRATDQAVSQLMEKLGLGDNTLVIVVADHGEEFMEHGHMDHRLNGSVYNELIHVPMLMLLPGRKHAGKVIQAPVSSLDVVATVMDILGQPIEGQTSGRSLVPLIEGKPFEARPQYTELHEVNLGEFRAIIEQPWKYIHSFKTGAGKLFDLSADPTEMNDLLAKEPARAEAMKKKLLEWTASLSPKYQINAPPPLSPQEIQKLKEMGYMK